MPIDALSILCGMCAQLTRDLLAIAKFLFLHLSHLTMTADILLTLDV